MTIRTRTIGAALVFVACTGAASAVDTPGEYAWRWPLAASVAPLQRIVLPPAIYDGVAHADLRDLRVFNAAGEVVPYAFVPTPVPAAQPARVALPLFPLQVDRASASLDDVSLRVRRSAGGTTIEVASPDRRGAAGTRLAGYVVDAAALDAPVSALVVDAEGDGNIDVRLRIDASDDLASWQVVANTTALVRLVVDGRTLARDRLPLTPRKARYLRIATIDGMPMPPLAGIAAEIGAPPAEPPIDWRTVDGAPVREATGATAFVYDTGAAVPATRLTLELPASNSVLPLAVLARAREADEWRNVAEAVVYRLDGSSGELRSPAVHLGGSAYRHWKVVPDPRAGINSAPRLSVGWVPPQIVFAARGDAPFELAYGRRDASAGALPLATLVPQPSARDLVERAPALVPIATPVHGNAAALEARLPVARIALWATLVVAALLLLAFGLRLLRQVQGVDPPGAPPS
jgi:hypothetical protein